jgi:hypothetical protein
VLLVAALVVLRLAATDRDGASPPLRGGELSAEALVDSIGVSVHLNYVDTAYGRQAEVVDRLRELGVRHIREAMPTPPVGPLADGLRAVRRIGLDATLGTGDVNVPPARAVADSLVVMDGSVAAFEGPNELDNSDDPRWPEKLAAYMPRLEAAVREQAPGVPVIGPSFVNPDSRRLLPAGLPGISNLHPYPGGRPPEPVLREALRELGGVPPRGVFFTETGYHNALEDATEQPPVSERVAAVYLPRLLVTAFGAGVRRTYVYELLDEKPDPGLTDLQQHFGLLRNDLSRKPAFTAIRTMITALRTSPGAPRDGGQLRWRLEASGGETVNRLTLRRTDGSHVIALWRPVSVWDRDASRPLGPDPLAVEIRFGRQAREVVVWRPSSSPSPVLRRPAARELSLDPGGELVLVSLR